MKYNHGENSIKIPFVIYAYTEFLLEKIDTYDYNPGKSLTTEVNKHTTCSSSLVTKYSFNSDKNKHDHCGNKGCMENLNLKFKRVRNADN